MTEFEKAVDYTLKQYNCNKQIKKHKNDKDKILACKTIKDLLLVRKKLGMVEWKNIDLS